MKRLVVVAILVGALAALVAGTALAAGPVTPPTPAQGFGMGVHTPGTGLTNPGTGYGPGMMGAGAGGMMGGMVGRGAPEWAGEPEAVEKLLGMTEEQIQVERLAGKSLVQIAAGKKIGEETLIKTILDAKKTDLAKLVADSKLTQAQMDTMVERMQTQVKTMVGRTSVGPAFNQGQNQTRPGMGQSQGQNQAQPGAMQGRGNRGGRGATR